jgi:ankyrin repeat protein
MLNMADQDGNTALMYSANNKNPEIAKIILQAGKFTPDDLEKKNANGETFLSYAKKAPTMATLLNEATQQAHKNTLAELRVVQSAMPMLKRQ